MRVRQTCSCILLLVLAAGLGGCVIVDVRDVGGGSGGWGHRSRGSYSVVRPIAGSLAGYDGIMVGHFTGGRPGGAPRGFAAHLAAELRDELHDEKLPSRPGSRNLTVAGTITRFGPYNVTARVHLVDAQTHAVLGIADCIGGSRETDPAKAPRKKARGLAKAIVEWIKTRYPERDD